MLIGRAQPRPPRGDAQRFRCGHPRTADNSKPSGRGQTTCKLCGRVRHIVRQAELHQQRINAGLPIDGRLGAARDWL